MVNSQLTSVFSGTICRSRMATAKTRAISNQARGDNLARSAGLQSGTLDTAPIFEFMRFPGRAAPALTGPRERAIFKWSLVGALGRAGSWCRKRDSNPRPRHYE